MVRHVEVAHRIDYGMSVDGSSPIRSLTGLGCNAAFIFIADEAAIIAALTPDPSTSLTGRA
jgi:hypothetical protein